MKQRIKICLAVTPLFAGSVSAAPAAAPDTDWVARTSIDYAQSVAERSIEVYDRSSIRLGSWLLFPALELKESYDSNVYATELNEKDDFITSLKPGVRLDSDWSVHRVQFEVGGDFGYYHEFVDENYQDYFIRNRNTLEVLRATEFFTDVLYRHAHAPRTSPDNIGAATEPTEHDVLSGTLGFQRTLGTFALRVDGNVEDIQYDDAKRIGGGVIDNSDQDRQVSSGGLKFSYRPASGNEAYLSARVREVTYDDSTKNGGADRDNQGFNLTLGIEKSISDLWVIDSYIGYAPSYYADDLLSDVTGARAFVAGASLLWNPTALTSLVGNLDRRSYETTQPNASAIVNTSLSLRLEHKLTQSVLLDADVEYNYNDYYGSLREDTTYTAGLGASYYLTRLVSLRGSYEFSNRDSSFNANDYVKHVAMLQIRLNF